MLTAEAIGQENAGPFGAHLHLVSKTRSTNDDLLEKARLGAPDGTVIIADEQSGGRGRLGRHWHSPAGTNLYISVLLKPEYVEIAKFPPLALVAGLAVVEALAECVGVTAFVKWPNDVLVSEEGAEGSTRKVCGVLAEAIPGPPPALVVGLGLNVNQTDFPDELSSIATSLRLVTGNRIPRAPIAATLLRSLHHRFTHALEGESALREVLEAWSARSSTLGRRIRTQDGIEGTAESIDASGALEVRLDSGELSTVLAGPLELVD